MVKKQNTEPSPRGGEPSAERDGNSKNNETAAAPKVKLPKRGYLPHAEFSSSRTMPSGYEETLKTASAAATTNASAVMNSPREKRSTFAHESAVAKELSHRDRVYFMFSIALSTQIIIADAAADSSFGVAGALPIVTLILFSLAVLGVTSEKNHIWLEHRLPMLLSHNLLSGCCYCASIYRANRVRVPSLNLKTNFPNNAALPSFVPGLLWGTKMLLASLNSTGSVRVDTIVKCVVLSMTTFTVLISANGGIASWILVPLSASLPSYLFLVSTLAALNLFVQRHVLCVEKENMRNVHLIQSLRHALAQQDCTINMLRAREKDMKLQVELERCRHELAAARVMQGKETAERILISERMERVSGAVGITNYEVQRVLADHQETLREDLRRSQRDVPTVHNDNIITGASDSPFYYSSDDEQLASEY